VGTGLGHYIPLLAYLGFWIMCIVSLTGRPLFGLYYLMPFVPYRTMRDHFIGYPLGENMLTLLIFAVIIGALLKKKHLPPSRMYLTWLLFGAYLYFSLWVGTILSNAPAPLWLSDINFVTWKDYMMIPLLFVAAGLVIEDRKTIRNIIIVTAISLLLIDKSALAQSLSRSWTSFDENKRDPGPLSFGVNQLAAFLAQFGMFFWGVGTFLKRWTLKLACYGMVAATLLATLYAFSRGAYLAVLVAVLALAILKDRKMLIVLGAFLLTWQTLVPVAVTQRVEMTETANGTLGASSQERIDLWEQSRNMFLHSPILGTGFATFQLGEHTDNLKDTHNWYVKVLVETGIIGGVFACILLFQMYAVGFRLFRKASDPLFRGLGLGFFLAVVSCSVANLFGDRWTYLEINGLLWVLAAAVARALQLSDTPAEPATEVPQNSALPWIPRWKGDIPAVAITPGQQSPGGQTI
jgi:putative inorganic carbon (HCO3(-)) transporter